MNFWEVFWAAFGAIGGSVGGVAGVLAYFSAHKANKLAENADSTAKEANRIAVSANSLAADANKLSGDANTISQKAFSATTDQTVYHWRIEFDYEKSTIFLMNNCALSARDVHAVVRYENKTLVEGSVDSLAGFEEVPLEDDFLGEQILKSQRSIDRINSQGRVRLIDTGNISVMLHIVWTSELGTRRSEEIKKTLRKTKRK
jgi:hypothetical protein